MSDCPILTDLKVQRAQLKSGMAAIKRDLKHCAQCPAKCQPFDVIKADLVQAITETKQEIENG